MTLPTSLSPRLAALREKLEANRGRLAFLIDATGSREGCWDLSTGLTAQMFLESAKIGGLAIQLTFFRGCDEVKASPWLQDAHALVHMMQRVSCERGGTQIERVLNHVRRENEREKVNAAILITDACEENPHKLYDAAMGLNVPLFLFLEGSGGMVTCLDQYGEPFNDGPLVRVETVFRELAKITGGAFCRFDAGAAKQLGEMLRAVSAFACGGFAALASQGTDSARLLLKQMK